ncbi:MAG: TRAP transporter TatT component family protein [Spirochaetota bacterium]
MRPLVRVGSILGVLLLSGCSINAIATRAVARALSGGDEPSVFVTDNDPELIADALPLALKIYDTLILERPEDAELLLAGGSAYISYANAFLQAPAGMLPPEEFEKRELLIRRAKNLYLRGRDYAIRGLEARHPEAHGILEGDLDSVVAVVGKEDVPYLYWISAGWLGAFSAEPFDMNLNASVGRAATLILRAYEVDPDFDDGAIDELLLSYYASVPEGLGGSRERATFHYERAVGLADGKKASPHVSYAVSVLIPQQKLREFRDKMDLALAVDAEAYPEYRLVNTIKQREAAWYLENLDRFFLVDLEEEDA